jgi:hypothetical protein
VGWQDRDWAKWTDEERARFYGSGPKTSTASLTRTISRKERRTHRSLFFAVLVSAGLTLGAALLHVHLRIDRGSHASPTVVVARRPVIYGSGARVQTDGSQLTCTSMVAAGGAWSCVALSIVMPGQHVAEAAPLAGGSSCSVAKVDQDARRWICLNR